jgi:hypothetical protein
MKGRNMKKRFLGIPVPIIAVILALTLVAGGVLAAWYFTKEIPGQIQIIGAECGVYQDEGCTVPLEALDFGSMRAGDTSDPIPAYIKALGEDPIYLALMESGLDPLLTLYVDGDFVSAAIPTDPDILLLITFEELIWQETGDTSQNSAAFDEVATSIPGALGDFPAAGGVMKVNDELIAYDSWESNMFLDCIRGYDGTTAAAHGLATLYLMEQVLVTVYELAPGEVLAVEFTIEADPAILRSLNEFILTVLAQDEVFP